MADALFTDEELEKSSNSIDNAILNDPKIMSVLVAPDGTTAKALPQDVDSLIQNGYRPLNSDSDWEVKPSIFSDYTYTVKGGELQDYVKAGYVTNKKEQFIRQQEELDAQQTADREAIGLSPIEAGLGLVSSAASGATFGATDVLTRAANELIGIAKGDDTYGADASKQLLEIRDQLGGYGYTAEMLGGLLTGGIAARGVGTLAKMGLMAAEGAAGNTLATAGRQALGDESINANSYLWAAGLGAGLGGGLGGIGSLISKATAKGAAKAIEHVDIDFGDLSRFKQEAQITDTLPILNNGKLLGTVEVSRLNPDSYHPGTRGSGVTLENITISPDAPKGTMLNVMRELTDNFGSVVSPSKMSALDNVKKDFSLMGSRKITEMGDEWFSITPDTLPRTVSEDTKAIGLVRKAMKLLGKMPTEDEKRSLEIVEKILDDNNGIHRKGYIEFMADPDKALSNVYKDFRSVEDMVDTQKAAAEAVRNQIGRSITAEGNIALKDSVLQVGSSIEESIQMLDRIQTNASRKVKTRLEGLANELNDTIIKNDNPVDTWRALLLKKREMFDYLQKYAADPDMDKEALDAFSAAYDGVNATLKSKKVIGEKAANILVELDQKAAQAAETSEQFMKEFGKTVGKKQVIDQTKITQAYKALREGTRVSKLSILDTYAADTADFARTMRKAKAAGLVENIELPDEKAILPLLDKVNTYREYIETSKVLSRMKGGNLLSGILQSTGATLGSLGGYAMGGPIAGVIGAQVGGVLPNLVGDPTVAIKFAQKATGALGTISKFTDKLSKASGFATRAAVPLQRTVILKQLGAKNDTDNKKYVDNVRTRIAELGSEASLNTIDGTAGDPYTEAEMKKTAKAAYDYALSKLPPTPKFSNVSKTDAMKVDKLLYALTNPASAMRKAVEEGDTELAMHLQNMFPVVYEMMQKGVMSKVDPDETLSYQKRLQLQKMTGIPYTRTSQQANILARSVFANKEEKGGKNPKLTIPGMPAGAEIQD